MENVNIIPFNEVEAEEVSWLFYPYIAYGKLTLLGGEAGCGKTMVALALASILSNGGKLPLQTEETKPINILYQTAEDGLHDYDNKKIDAIYARSKTARRQHLDVDRTDMGCVFRV